MLKSELLAPAGDFESLNAALRFGADAVYIGGDMLQLRAGKAGFTRENIVKAVEKTHNCGKKIYITVNSFTKNCEIEPLREYAKFLYDAGADAAIVSDIGAVSVIKKSAPDLAVHISTQANCCNWASAEVYYNMGAERVVLAREMTIDEIAELRDKAPKKLELEAFVHGAMCMSYSGRCILSSFINGKSGNRGECTQPCRWSYYLVEQKRPNEYFQIEESEKATTILSSNDLNCIEFLDDIARAGVCSFKIEGRMKTAYYVATVINAYRHKMDGYANTDILLKELKSVSHRPFSSGFYFNELSHNHYNDGAYHSDCLFTGVVLGKNKNGFTVQQRNMFRTGDILEVVTPDEIGKEFEVKGILDSNGNETDRARLVGEEVTVIADTELKQGDFLRIRKNMTY